MDGVASSSVKPRIAFIANPDGSVCFVTAPLALRVYVVSLALPVP
jgi:hypothetical protein